MIVKQLDQTDLIETLVGVSDADIQTLSQQHCADCGRPHDLTAMWYVPYKTRAICRACRDLKLASSLEAEGSR